MGKPAIFYVKLSPDCVNPMFCQFSCGIVHGTFGDSNFRRHFCQKNLWTSVKTLAIESVGPDGVRQDLSFGVNWSRQVKHPIFKVKGAPERSMDLLGDSDFRCHFCQNISCTSVQTLSKEPVGPDWKTDIFSRSNKPWSGFPTSFCRYFSWTPIKTLAIDPVGLDG
ncbi:hypothetical protein H5410_056596 [Solanum commersonii]|uniref:Uncharacterized protein n=1 Tax=Solanum commersonii TaxID=4109 RepID=A0A9J5WNJ0_SOLCO|nr:hypothetical protein H5410_056596 [Solanum commersonii]